MNNKNNTNENDNNNKKGFASMPHEKVVEIARKGGEASHKETTEKEHQKAHASGEGKKEHQEAHASGESKKEHQEREK